MKKYILLSLIIFLLSFTCVVKAQISDPGSVFLIGGGSGNYMYNDVLKSSGDLIHWKEILPSTDPNTDYRSQMYNADGSFKGFVHSKPTATQFDNEEVQAIYFNGKLYVFSGRLRMVPWTSVDGITWTQLTTKKNDGSSLELPKGNVVVYNNKLWIISGCYEYVENGGGGCSEPYSDLSSSDGITWTKDFLHKNNSKFDSEGPGIQPFVFNGKLWSFGGRYYGDVYYSKQVWSSIDGINWDKINDNGIWVGSAGARFESIVFQNKIWVFGGSEKNKHSIFSSSDGINWKLVKSDSGVDFSVVNARYGSVIIYDNKLWTFKNGIWSSPDAINWTLVTNNTGPVSGSDGNGGIINNFTDNLDPTYPFDKRGNESIVVLPSSNQKVFETTITDTSTKQATTTQIVSEKINTITADEIKTTTSSLVEKEVEHLQSESKSIEKNQNNFPINILYFLIILLLLLIILFLLIKLRKNKNNLQ